MIKRALVERSASRVMLSKQASGSMVELENCLSEYRVKAVGLRFSGREDTEDCRKRRRYRPFAFMSQARMFTARMRTLTAD
jgi:hypothetical protein